MDQLMNKVTSVENFGSNDKTKEQLVGNSDLSPPINNKQTTQRLASDWKQNVSSAVTGQNANAKKQLLGGLASTESTSSL